MANDLATDELEQLPPARITPTPAPTPAPAPADQEPGAADYAAMFAEQDGGRKQQLRKSLVQSQDQPADRAADVIRLSQQTGIPQDVVGRNYDDIRKTAAVEHAPLTEMVRDTPHLATWAANPVNAAVAHDDLGALGAIEYLLALPGRAVAQSYFQTQAAALQFKTFLGPLTQEERDQKNVLDFYAGEGSGVDPAGSWHKGFITKSMQFAAGLIVPAARDTAIGAATGAVIGGARGALAGPAGILPGAGAGAIYGAKKGWMIGLARTAFISSAGAALHDYRDVPDAFGHPIDPDVAKMTALGVGAFNAGLMLGGGKIAGAAIEKSVGQVAALWTKDAVATALRQPTVIGALKELAVRTGVSTSEMALFGASAEAASILGHAIAKIASGQPGEQITSGEAATRIAQSALESARDSALTMAAFAAPGVVADVRRAKQAEAGVAVFKALGDGVTQSKTFARLPQAMQDFVEQATKDGPVATLYTGVADWTTYWQEKGVDPKEMAAHVTGDPAAYDRALATGEDLAIPTARYATKLAATEHNAHFAEELRLGPEEMNGRESKAFIEKMAQAPDAGTPPEAGSPVYQAALEQLTKGGGLSEDTASHYATLVDSAFGSMAQRAGVDPVELYRQYGLTVDRPDLPADGAPKAAPTGGAGARDATLPLEARGVTDAHGVPVDAYAGPDRRAAETGAVSTLARRSTDEPIPVMADIVGAAAAMRRENPNIDREAQAMRDQATAAGRIPEPKGRDGVVDKNADAAHNPENYHNAEAQAAPASDAPPLSPAEEGAGSRDAQGQQPGADVEGHGQGRGDGDVAQPGRPAPRGIPELDELFERQPREHTEARLTPHVERELRRILDEMQREGYEGKTWDWSPAEEHGKTGNAAGGAANIIGGHAGAPVYDDVLSHSPMNRVTSGERKGQPADEAHGSRAKVERAIAALIDTRHVTNNLMEGALRVAENRDAGIWRDLSRPSILPPWAETVPRAFTEALSEAIDREQQPANLLDARDISDSVETGDAGDTSFDVEKFYQSLFNDLEPPDPTADTLTEKTAPAVDTRTVEERKADYDARRFAAAKAAKTPLPPEFETLDALDKKAGRAGYNPDVLTASNIAALKDAGLISGRTNFKLTEEGRRRLRDARDLDHANNMASGDAYDNFPDFDPTVDVNEHSEQQPRLPGDVGAVREQDVKTPEFEAPFALQSEVAKPMARGKRAELPLSAEYIAAKDAADTASADFRTATDAYRKGDIDDATYLEARRLHEEASQAFDTAFTKEQRRSSTTSLFQGPIPALTKENVAAWAQEVKDRAGRDLQGFSIVLTPEGDLFLESLIVDRGAQRAGLGTKALLELTRFADLNGARVTLTPAHPGDIGPGEPTSTGRLVKFYRRFGFLENKGRQRDFSISEAMYREPTAIPGRDYSGQSASVESHPDGAGLDAKLFTDLFKGEPLTPEGDRLASAPSLVSMIGKVRAAAFIDPKVFGAIVRAVPVDVVDNLFGSKAAAEEALRNDPVFQDRAAVDAQLPVAEPVDAASPVSLLLREIARLAAEDGPVADAAGKAANGSAATGTGEGGSFSQPRRASIRFGPDRQFTISLLERADLSSFLHESGHFFLEVFGDLADQVGKLPLEQLTEEQKHLLSDYGTTLQALGVEHRDQIGTEHHETFARMFEAYLREGKAPSLALQTPFARFRAWLLSIYDSMKKLNVTLTPEVTGVLDRMLASDHAIAEAEQQRGVDALFTTPERAGMESREFELYRRTIADAHQEAQQHVDARLMREVFREQTRQWKDRRAEVQTEVEGQVHQQPEYGAIEAMRKGTHPNGEPLVEGLLTPPLQLSRAILEDRWPGRAKRLPRGIVGSADGGLDPDLVAGMFGYSSADALLTAVEKAPPMKDVIEQETKRRMIEEHGSILLDGSLHDTAQAAVANETHDEVIRAEMRALGRLRRTVEPFVKDARAQGAEALQQEQAERAYERRWFEAEAKLRIAIAEGHKQVEIDTLQQQVGELKAKARGGAAVIRNAIPDAATLREAAAARINAMRIGEIQPATFWSAARRAGQQAVEKAARQDYDGAITAKQQELLNLALYRHAEQALEDIDDRVRFAKSLGTPAARKMFGLAGQSYLDQVDGILDRFEFATVSQKVLDRRGSLQKFVEGIESQGLPVDLPDELLDESRRRNYKQLTVEELQGVTDGLKELQHLARLKNRLLRREAQRTLDETAATIGQSIRDHFTGRKPDVSRDRTTGETGRMIANFMASHVRLADFTREMDGGVDGGPLTTAVMYRLNEAGGKEAEMSAAATKALGDLFETAYPLSQKRQLFEKLEIPAIGKSLSKMERLMYALNWGNEGNRQRIRTYEKWTDDQVGAILNTLDQRDLTLVQGILDHVNSYKDAIIAKQERVYGVAPTTVDPTPIKTSVGEIPGGYFPLKYDDRLTGKAENFEAGNLAKLASYNNATTARGHTKERVSNVKMPLQLNPGVIFSHVQQVIHDLTHHEALIDIGRILAHSDVMKAILETHGDIAYKHMKDALRDVAIGQPRSTEGFSNVLAHFRSGAAIANLGWSMTVPMLHLSGALPKGINAIGAEWAAKGIMRWFRGPEAMQSTAEWINANNLGMANRGRTQTRELSEIRSAFGIDTGRFSGWVAEVLDKTTLGTVDKQKIADSYFYLVTKSQQIADYVVYLGQFEKSRAAGEPEARAHQIAEQRVLDAFGGGQNKDLPSVMRGGALLKTWTTFYGPFNSTFNAMRHATKRVDGTALSVGRLGVDYLMLWAVPAVLGWGVRAAMQSGAAGSSEDWNAKTLAGELGRAGVAYLADMMVGTRELAGAIHGYHNYEGPAGASIFAKVGHLYQVGEHAAQKIAAGQGDEVVNGATFKALDDVGGIMFHYPAGQLGRTVGGLAALIDGRTKNPAALLFGAPPKPK